MHNSRRTERGMIIFYKNLKYKEDLKIPTKGVRGNNSSLEFVYN